MVLPRFENAARIRPVALIQHVQVRAGGARSATPCPRSAPYASAVATGVGDRLVLSWRSGADVLEAEYADGRVRLHVTAGGRTTTHASRRRRRLPRPADAVALTLTGTHLTVLARSGDEPWEARGRVDVSELIDTRDAAWLAELSVAHEGTVEALEAGSFGQLGLRDLRLTTHADGTPYRSDDGRAVLTATSAGPGFFDTAHTSVWALDTEALELEHLSDLYFRRAQQAGVFGDHATHLVRDGDGWLVATSTWGAFEVRPSDAERERAGVSVTIARTDADLLRGEHVLDTEPLILPTSGFTSVGVWDPHLLRTGDGWLVGYVSARRFFRFHPVVASGPALDRLEVRGVDPQRRSTEGTTLARLGGEWLVLASDGRDGRRGQRERYPVFDLSMREIGALDAPYPTNIPWPTLVPVTTDPDSELLMVGFDGSPWGGSLLGYGTHGDVVIARSVSPGR
ncbi:MAG: hypothetical protein ACXVD1_04940 [Nocardioides sp.]